MEINKRMIDELYSFIVDSNLEHSIMNQCENEETKKDLIEWFQLEKEEE